jgi:hypothetical protein
MQIDWNELITLKPKFDDVRPRDETEWDDRDSEIIQTTFCYA